MTDWQARALAAERALRDLAGDMSVEAFIGYMPLPATAAEIEVKFEAARAVLAAAAAPSGPEETT
jgi:hypothetical protein